MKDNEIIETSKTALALFIIFSRTSRNVNSGVKIVPEAKSQAIA